MSYQCNEIDLHIHTVDSDGKCTGKQIVNKAHEEGIRVISITNHNVYAEIKEVKELADSYGITVVPGIEFTVAWEDVNFHLLAYFNDDQADSLKPLLAKYNRLRSRKLIEYMKKLKESNILISEKKIAEFGRLSFKNIARELVLEGYAKNYDEAMEKYIDNTDFFNCKTVLQFMEVMETVHSIGGIVSLAHPFISFSSEEQVRKMVGVLAGLGIDGIECFNGKDTNNKMDVLHELAGRYHLIETGGSDFHGSDSEQGLGIRKCISLAQAPAFWEAFLG